MATVAHIYRHPIKGFGAEEMDAVDLKAGLGVPWDRHWAIAHGKADVPATPTEWIKPGAFVSQSRSPKVAQTTCSVEDETGLLALHHPDLPPLAMTSAENARLTEWLTPLTSPSTPPPYRMVHVPGQAMTDFDDTHLSIAGLRSLKALEEAAGAQLAHGRFRMNLWLAELPPWGEFDLLGRRARLGAAEIEITMRDERCAAIHANPRTGLRDVEVTKVLYQRWRHTDFGVYAKITRSGRIATGDTLELL